MKLDPSVFDFDVERYLAVTVDFIACKLKELGRKGIVVPLSGGLDSSTAAALAVHALGPRSVTALLLPDRKGSAEAVKYAKLVTRALDIKAVVRDTTAINRAAGVYEAIAVKFPFKSVVARGVHAILAHDGASFFKSSIAGTDNPVTRESLASIYAKQRLRMVVTFRYAELHRLMVVGSAHKSEDLLGLFVKFGIDDAADLMPMKRLYRTQVLKIAARLGVPEAILKRTPNPEMLPGIVDKYQDVLQVDSAAVDLALWGIEHGVDDALIAAAIGQPESKAAELREIVRLSAHMRNPSQCPNWP